MSTSTEPAKAEEKAVEETHEEPVKQHSETAADEKPNEPSEDSEGGAKKEGEGEEGEEGSNSLVRGSYLPINKLKDAPDASHYEGMNPADFCKTRVPGFFEQLGDIIKKDLKEKRDFFNRMGQKIQSIPDSVTRMARKHKEKKKDEKKEEAKEKKMNKEKK